MGRWFAALVVSGIVVACGGDTDSDRLGAGGSGAASGGGAGGAATGGSGNGLRTSPGTVTVEFSVPDPGAYCRDDDGCGTEPLVSIEDRGGNTLILSPGWCPTMCDDCMPQPCPGLACQLQGVEVIGATLTWDGTYYSAGTCGGSTACLSKHYAPAGTYLARFCAARGTLVTSTTTGGSECIESGAPECSEVSVELPSGHVFEGTVAPGGSGTGGSPGTGGVPSTGGMPSTGGTTSDPVCTSADSNGFFASCASCPTDNCDTVSSGSGARAACGCDSSADCPCGFSCGSVEIAPNVTVSGLCVR